MNIVPTELPDVLLIEPRVFRDSRGFFFESWNSRSFAEKGLDLEFVQDNHSHSREGCLRGLHYQLENPQGKLVRVTSGRVWDVAVDLRRSSPSFGRWIGVWLEAESGLLLWIPPGFAHGFYVASHKADLAYKCTDFYLRADERTIRWDDPTLAISWPLEGREPILSEKDAAGSAFVDAQCFS